MIIGMVGKMGAGKTTVSDYVVEKYGFRKINFKDSLIDEMKQNFHGTLLSIAELYRVISLTWSNKWTKKEPTEEELINFLFIDKPPIMRSLLQNYGTEVRRGDNDRYWVEAWCKKVSKEAEEQDIIVDDVRFLNEADAVKLLGGKIIRIERTDYLDLVNHRSETEQDNIISEYQIKAKTGEKESLYKQFDKIINEQRKED